MSSLQVLVQFSQGGASGGNAGPAFGAVSVADANGAGIRELQDANFKFWVIAEPQAKGGPITHRVNSEPAGTPDGFYMFSLFPGLGGLDEKWAGGDYLVGVQVQDGSAQVRQRGQATGVLRVPPRGGFTLTEQNAIVLRRDEPLPDPTVDTL